VSFAAITLCVASQRELVLDDVVYFVIDSVRKLLDTLSYNSVCLFLFSSFSFCEKLPEKSAKDS
jgi:hypothetical protein